jgi:hypothetical protein
MAKIYSLDTERLARGLGVRRMMPTGRTLREENRRLQFGGRPVAPEKKKLFYDPIPTPLQQAPVDELWMKYFDPVNSFHPVEED